MRGSINIPRSFLESSPRGDALPFPALFAGGNQAEGFLINRLKTKIDQVFWEDLEKKVSVAEHLIQQEDLRLKHSAGVTSMSGATHTQVL